MESRSLQDDEKIDALESQLKEAKFISEDADTKYDEVCGVRTAILSACEWSACIRISPSYSQTTHRWLSDFLFTQQPLYCTPTSKCLSLGLLAHCFC